jgi:hypothetical protein
MYILVAIVTDQPSPLLLKSQNIFPTTPLFIKYSEYDIIEIAVTILATILYLKDFNKDK